MKRSQDIYSKKQRWKLILFLLASTIILGSIYLSNAMVAKIANKEQAKAKQWAQTIQKKVALLNITKRTFESLENREKQRIQLVVDAIKTIMNPSELSMNQDLDFAMKIRDGNKDIPMVILDDRNLISSFSNIDFKSDSSELSANHKKRDSLLQEKALQWKKEQRFFTIEVFEGVNFMLTYDQSQSLKSLRFQSDSILQAFNKDLIKDTRLMPVVLMDQNKKRIIASNIEGGKDWDGKQLKAFQAHYPPIKIDLGKDGLQWLYYDLSPELKQLKWFPFIQFGIIAVIVLIGYLVFSTFRRAEQNQVWAGMAKETAHQLGTPISSLAAWMDYLEGQYVDADSLSEMRKDITRLEKVTDRFSKIGSEAKLNPEDLDATVNGIVSYLRPRLSDKVTIEIINPYPSPIVVNHNPSLMDWVIENVCKNAVDAMDGAGTIKVIFLKETRWVHVDIEDNGKGMLKNQFKSVFQPGYSTKKRGWGLGLSLAKRIIETSHKGKVFVLKSELNKGTTFRISLPL